MSERNFWSKIDIDPMDICSIFYNHYYNMWKNKNFFYDDSELWIKVYNSYSHKLRDVCLSLPLEKKGVLLGDLEKLASKYSQKSQE